MPHAQRNNGCYLSDNGVEYSHFDIQNHRGGFHQYSNERLKSLKHSTLDAEG